VFDKAKVKDISKKKKRFPRVFYWCLLWGTPANRASLPKENQQKRPEGLFKICFEIPYF
jgi:hypothetical protein